MSKKSKNEHSESHMHMEWSQANKKNLFLDKMTKASGHLSNLSTNKKGKEVPVGKQILNYLKSMKLLEKSVDELEDTIEKSEEKLKETKLLEESKIIKKKYMGKTYSTTSKMINAVSLYEAGKISYNRLIDIASWADDPEGLIEVSKMIAGIGRFRKYKK